MHPSLEKFNTIIQQSRGKVPKHVSDYIDEIASKAISEAIKEITISLSEFLSYELEGKDTIEQVKAIIEFFPDSLSQLNDDNLPIQDVIMYGSFSLARSYSFIPLMAKEGCRLGVGGEGNRGGLLSVMPCTSDGENLNTIQYLANRTSMGHSVDDDDRNRAHVLKELRDMDLLKKTDIEEYGLLQLTNHSDCKHRFEFFSSWDPGALGPRNSQSRIPIHSALGLGLQEMSEGGFEMVLKAGMKYFPEQLGFLFCKENKITACKKAFDKFGVGPAMNIIRRCIPLSGNYPILHHAIEYVPDLADDIAQFYPDAAYLRNSDGHTLSQFEFYISLRRGRKTFQKQSLFFIRAKDDKVNRVDPKTGLYPFMSAAVGNKSDLSAVFYLLSRNPKLVGLDEKKNEKKKAKDYDAGERNKRKRQRNKRKRQQND